MNLLIIGPSWVGDMVISNSLLQHLKRIYPGCKIDVLAPAWCNMILKKMPEVDGVITMPVTHGQLRIGARRKIAASLPRNYDRAIVLPNSFKSSLIPFFAKIPVRTGYTGELRYGVLNDRRSLDKETLPLMHMRYNALAYPKNSLSDLEQLRHPYPHLQVDRSAQEIAKAELSELMGLNYLSPFIAICPGAEFGPAKCWPHYHYSYLSNQLIEEGFYVIILGSAKDRNIAQKIREGVNKQDYCLDLTGKTQLDTAVDILSIAHGVVSNDSGLMHIAAALDRPLVALFGPTSPQFTPPLSSRARILRKIEGYFPIRHSKDSPEGYHRSLIDLSPEEVHHSITSLLAT
ncbi:MAG: lipopolysaccharide heptosyltransferase II [Neisseriaceae bacterium]